MGCQKKKTTGLAKQGDFNQQKIRQVQFGLLGLTSPSGYTGLVDLSMKKPINYGSPFWTDFLPLYSCRSVSLVASSFQLLLNFSLSNLEFFYGPELPYLDFAFLTPHCFTFIFGIIFLIPFS